MGIFGKRDQNSHRRQGLAAGASVSTPTLASPMALALEPRFMFDAAGAVTATDIAAQTAADSLAAPAARNELVVVDTSVAGYSTLIDGLAPGAQVLEIGAGQDGLQVLADALAASGQTYDAIHIVSHGSEGQVQLGTSLLTAESMASYTDVLTTLGSSLTADGDLLLYGCEVGSDTGQAFVNDLAMLTGADVAASNDLTGAAALGGDWVLEVVAGSIEAGTPFSAQALTDFSIVLALPSGTQSLSAFTDTGATLTDAGGYFVVSGKDGTPDGTDVAELNKDASGGFLSANGGTMKTGNYIKVVADGTKLGTFQLSSLVLTEFAASNNFQNVQVTGYLSGGGTVLSGIFNGTAGADTIAPNMTNFSGQTLTGFKVVFDTVAGNNNDFTFESFTVTAAAAPSVDPTITSSTYDASTGVVVVTGTNFTATGGATNDVVANKFTFTGEGGATYTLTDTANVEIASATSFTLTLSATDKAALNQMVNTNGTASTGGTTYDLDGAAGFIAASGAISDTGVNGVTVSNVTNPAIASAAYNFSTNVMTVTGTNFVHKSGGANDVDLSLLTFAGEGGGTYTLTTATDVEITNGTTFSFTLSGADLVGVESLLGRDGATAVSGTTYNIAGADNWMAGATAANNIADLTGNGVTVSNYAVPTITSATYDFSTGVLVFTGTDLVAASGANNDIIANKFTFTGDGGATYALTDTSNVEVTSATAFTITLSATDRLAIGGLLNKNGTASDTGTTYNINAAEDWIAGAPATNNVVDATGNGVTVSNYTAPAITSAAYNYSTNVLTVTGTNFVNEVGATNDVDISLLTFTGEGGATYTLTSASDVEVTSATSFTVTLSGADLLGVEALLNKDGTTSATSTTTFNLAAADNWMPGAAATPDISDATNAVTVSAYAVPTITSATYDFNTGALVFTGTNLVAASGATNDIIANKFTFTGDGGATYALTDTSNVEITSATAFTITLSATDKLAIGGLLNKNGTASDTGTTYNINAAEDWVAGAPAANNVVDATGNGVTVSNYTVPAITSAAYNYSTNVLTVTGTNFVNEVGATNDVDISMFTFTGEGGATYTLTSASDVEITSATSFSVTLAGADLTNVEALLNKDGTTADSGATFNLAAADNWMPGAAATPDISDATNAITVSNYASPTITSATYDFGTGALVLTGTNFVSKSGATNDLIANTLTLTGDGGTYTLTDTANVEITSATAATLTLSATDQLNIRGLLNKNGTASGGAVTYNVAAADNWMAASPAAANIADPTGNGVTVSNVAAPTVTSATYDSDTGVLVVTGTNLFKKIGATNDIDISTLTLTGGTGNATYTITSTSDVEITSATSFSVTLSGTDKTSVDALLDQIGTTSTGGSTYNLAAADNWLTGADAATNIADASAAVTVSINPKVTSATYDAATGSLVVTGTNMQAQAGVTNDITANKFTLTGEGGSTYTLTDTANVEIASATSFTLTLSATDKAALNQIMNKNGTSSTGATTFNIAAADDWNAQVTAGDTSDATSNAVTVSNVAAPTISATGTTYNASTGVLTLTGTGFLKLSGATNDIVANKFTFTGEGGATYTLTDTANVEITSGTAATITLSATDKEQVNRIVNKNGTTATAGTTYNINAAEDWAAGADAAVNVVDATGNGITVSNVAVPAITSTAYDASAGTLVVTGTGFLSATGATNDVIANKFTFTGEGGNTYTLTNSSNVEIASTTGFTITLSATDKSAVNMLMNKNGTNATAGNAYNVSAAEDWAAGADAAVNVADGTTGVTVSNVSVPAITSSTYNAATGALVVTGTGFTSANGGTNDIDVSLFTFTGANGATYTLTSATDVEITSDTAFTITLSGADKLAVDGLMDKNGTASDGGTTYNLAAAEDWARGSDAALNVADTTATITVSNTTAPTVTSATYDATTNQLVVTGANFVSKSGAANDIDISMLTLTGEGGATYTLTSATDVEITSATAFTVTLSGVDLLAVEGLLNKNGTASDGGTTYNLGAADNWAAAAAPSANIADATGNGVTVSNVAVPAITSATYDISTGVVTVTGTNFVSKSGAANDVDVSLLTFTGDGGVTYTLTSATDVEVTSATAFSLTLSGADKLAVDGLLNKNGTASDGGTTYNLAAADNWMTGAAATTDIADATGNGITASNYAAPTITSATFNSGTGVVVVTGTGFTSKSGAANDIDLSMLTFTGKGGATYTLSTATDVEITSDTSFTATLSGADLTGVKALLDKTGTAASDATTYNMAGADNWLVAGATSVNIADATNAVTVTLPTTTTTTSSTTTLNITQIGAASSPSSSAGEPGEGDGDSGDSVPATVAVPGGTTVVPVGTTAGPRANTVEASPGFTYGQDAADPMNGNALSIISNTVNGRGDVINAFYGAGRSGTAGFRGDDGAHKPTGNMRDTVGNMLGNSVMNAMFGGFSAFGDIGDIGGNEEGANDGGGNDGAPGAGAALAPAGRSSFTNQLAAASGALSADVQRLAAAMSQG